jgi:RNA polymerase sigma-70 factor (ECF subfamily)
MDERNAEGPGEGEATRKPPRFEEVAARYWGRVYRVALHLTGRPEDAEDACQEVFLYLARHLSEFRGDSALFTWIFRIARNAGLRQIRKRGMAALPDDFEGESPAPGESPAEAREKQEAIRRAFLLLPDNPRAVASMHLLEGIPLKDVAVILETPEGTVRWWLFRAREILRKHLAPWAEGKGGRE